MTQLKPLDGTDVYLWKYLPSIPLATAAAAVFLISTIGITWRMFTHRSWFCIAFVVGGFFQISGYAVRLASHNYTNEIAPYAIQNSLIILAPVFYAASIYMTLGRIIRSIHGDRFSLIRPNIMTKVFVWGDLAALSVQGNGPGLTAKQSTAKIGQWIIIAGLFIQLATFGFFIVATGVFHKRMARVVRNEPLESRPTLPWKAGLYMLYACSILIMVRSVFRVVEYIMGTDGYLLTHEWTWYVFDTLLMAAVQIIFWIWFPSRFIAKSIPRHEYGHVLAEQDPSKYGRQHDDGGESRRPLQQESLRGSHEGTETGETRSQGPSQASNFPLVALLVGLNKVVVRREKV